jgi:DNA-binding transcriptional regulator YiaG
MHDERMSITPEKLREAREGLGESQAEFAARLGVNQTTVSRWETGGVPKGTAAFAVERLLEDLVAR